MLARTPTSVPSHSSNSDGPSTSPLRRRRLSSPVMPLPLSDPPSHSSPATHQVRVAHAGVATSNGNALTCRRRRVDSWVWSVGPGGIPAAAPRPAYGTRRRPSPADPLRDHRRRHRGELRQQNPNPVLEPVEHRPSGRPRIRRRPLRRQRPRDRLPREAQPVSDRSLRQPLRHMKATDLRPLLHGDHPPNLGSGGPQLAERHWSPLQRASTAGDRVRRAAHTGTGPVACGAASLFRRCAGRCSLLDRTPWEELSCVQ